MPEENEPQFDPRYQTERIGFDAAELAACGKCGRANSPGRVKCVYCGNELALDLSTDVKLSHRRLEPWEKGWNVVAVDYRPDADAAKIGAIVDLDGVAANDFIENGPGSPIARTETLVESEVLLQRLTAVGVSCRIVSDETLNADVLPIRLGGMEFFEARMNVRDFNTGQLTSIAYSDLALIVTGELIVERTDLLEKKRRRGKSKVLDETQTSIDEPVVDIYSRADPRGFRVNLAGFDFSCLGDAMGLYAVENIRSLVAELRARCPAAHFVSGYQMKRPLLDPVWEIESRKDSRGLVRAGFGKVEFGSIASTSNLRQFTKFSRLQWHLL